MKKNLFWAVLLALFWMGLDWGMLSCLPLFGLSYGPVLPTWIVFTFFRAMTMAIWLLLSSGRLVSRRSTQKLGWQGPVWVQVLLSVLVVYGFYIEPFQLTVGRVTVETDRLPAGQRLRVVHLSDLHMEWITPRERALIPLVNSLQPDVIVWTGDYFNLSFLADPLTWQHTRQILEQLQAPLGVYAVNGSVEEVEQEKRLFAGMKGVRVLDDEAVSLDVGGRKLWIVGVSDVSRPRDREELGVLTANLPADDFRLLLYHSPDLMDLAVAQDVDLYLAGHTHGGQVRLPLYGALVTFSDFGKRYEMGLYHEQNTTLYVTRGLGMEGSAAPRVRFLAPPEVVVIELVGTGR
ncbi:MAG: metallophosphoesterase [Anaerolinea sp.]|nr:metallophosphoesterase [Anaerolinea sp.]